VLPLPPIEEIIPDPSSEAGTIAPPNTEKIPEDTTAVNSEPETATIVEVTSETDKRRQRSKIKQQTKIPPGIS